MTPIGIISVNGNFRNAHDFKHIRGWGYEPTDIRTSLDLSVWMSYGSWHLIIPGGKSADILDDLYETGIAHQLLDANSPYRVWGLCAGLVCISRDARLPKNADPAWQPLHREPLGLLDVSVERFGWSSQKFSAEVACKIDGLTFGIGEFYEGPRVLRLTAEQQENGVEVVAELLDGETPENDNPDSETVSPCFVRQGRHIGTSFWDMDKKFERSILDWWTSL